MSNKNLSVFEAFRALNEIEDFETDLEHETLNEGKLFNVRDSEDMDNAKSFLENEAKKEVTLEVIDVDADSLDHLKNNEEYVGQIILQCNACNSTHFEKMDNLEESEKEKGVYNLEKECPHCHVSGKGFTLVGQVGAVEDSEVKLSDTSANDSEEPAFDNDEQINNNESSAVVDILKDKIDIQSVDNKLIISGKGESDNSDAPKIETEADEEEVAILIKEFSDSEEPTNEEPEMEQEETTEESEEETEEKPEEEPVEDEEEMPNKKTNDDEEKDLDLAPEEESEEEKANESLNEEIELPKLETKTFLSLFVEPENIDQILIYDLDDDEILEKIKFKGNYDLLPLGILKSHLVSFSTSEGKFNIRVSDSSESNDKVTLAYLLDLYEDEFNDHVIVVDSETDDELIMATPETIKAKYGDKIVDVIECPERLEIKVRDLDLKEELVDDIEEDLNFNNYENVLISQILKENNLKDYKVNKYGTTEYWIKESILRKEDLDFVFDTFVKGKGNKKLTEDFKRITGYKTQLDILLEEEEMSVEPRKHTPGEQVSEDDMIAKAKEILKENPELTAVVYGYVKNGFKSLPLGDFMEIKDDKELAAARDIIIRDYQPTGAIRVLYRENIKEYFNSRKDLKNAILECKNNNRPYTVKSLRNSSYILIKENFNAADLKEEIPAVIDTESELEDNDEVDFIPAVIDPILIRISEVATNMSQIIEDCYNVSVDDRAILLDILRDLNILNGTVSVDSLGYAPIDQITRELYLANNIKPDLDEAIKVLNSSDFDEEALKETICSPKFLQALRSHEVPGVTFEGDPEDIALIEEDMEEKPEIVDEEDVEFDEKKFEEAVKKHLNKTFVTESGYISDEGNLILEGHLDDSHVTFTINPNDKYSVKSECLTEEVHYNMDESFLWFYFAEDFDTEDQAKEFIEGYLKKEEERVYEPDVKFDEEKGKWYVLFSTFDLIDMEKWKKDFGHNQTEESPVETPEDSQKNIEVEEK